LSNIPTGAFAGVYAGYHHTCALRSIPGPATCWGSDLEGQVSSTPAGLNFVAFAGGTDHTCGQLADSKEPMCWGSDTHKQVSSTPVGTPLAVARALSSDGDDSGSHTGSNENCSMSHMICPIPTVNSVVGNYTIPGFDQHTGPCRIHGSGNDLYFNLSYPECKVTKNDTAPNVTTFKATLEPYAPYGAIIFMEWPTMYCVCEIDTMSGVAFATVTPTRPNTTHEMEAGFEPNLTMYPDASFSAPLEYNVDEGGFVVTSDRFFFEASSSEAGDIVAFKTCFAKPTETGNDQFKQFFLKDHCAIEPFNASFDYPTAVHSEQRMSVRAFQFAGFDSLYIECTIVRCVQAPCGTCQERRLQAVRHSNHSKHSTLGLSLKLSPGSGALLLPGLLLPGDVTESTPHGSWIIVAVVVGAVCLIMMLMCLSAHAKSRIHKRSVIRVSALEEFEELHSLDTEKARVERSPLLKL